MIAHVAEAGEGKGRVVLRLGSGGQLSEVAVEAAARVAQAFQSEVEGLFIEDRQLFDFASLPFAREIAFSGRSVRGLSIETVARELTALSAAVHRDVARIIRTFDVPALMRTVRDDPVSALARVCADNGPWNVVTLGEQLTPGGLSIEELFSKVRDTTGLIAVGPNACRTSGPVFAVIEEAERVAPALRAAQRIASVTQGDLHLLMVEENAQRLERMEGDVRLALGSDIPAAQLCCAHMAQSSAASIAERLRRAGAGFVIVRFGGRVVACESDALMFAAMLEGALFLVR